MSTTTPSRPWYCVDRLVDEYVRIAVSQDGGNDLRMLKALKIVRSILVIAAIGTISIYALYLGADPTLVAGLSLPSLAAYAGVEAADYGALVQGFREAQAKSQSTDDTEGS
ncbi:hypothetical protein SAMN06269185_3262 [Natronoarchaeum philippinense]|uniref:Uncharacterized protein n=1 Tax=Natronoarchaeum philippinense TaxID=558529 RepID=A0A285PE62_NATPI|nr:hypothetical protein [Natronoarchaeum philippinense]SNZ18151.1 hypothetical protein SAMN06269185_3262 [Natronoarchaeum philippinense]